jgi:hypothetical protein
MYVPFLIGVILTALGVVAGDVTTARADSPEKGDPPHLQQARTTIERALTFLDHDAVKWRRERGCATCHHGAMTVWALSEAQRQGHPVAAEPLANAIQWTKERFLPRVGKSRDPRPGWDLVSVPAIYLGIMSKHLPVLSRDEVEAIAAHLAAHQEPDGTWRLPPPANGPPPTWESTETVALLASLAWDTSEPTDAKAAAAARAGQEKTAAWLAATPPSDTTQATALRLLIDVRRGMPAQRQAGTDRLLGRQNADGGWGQVSGSVSDAYATGQALYALSFAGVQNSRPEIGRAVSFLVASQRADGSWPMASRNHPGVQTTRSPIRNPTPIIYFGSAWATLGLVRSVASPLDTPARQQRAFDSVRAFGGTYEADETIPGRPVVRVDVRPYELDDRDVADLTDVLRAFPRLVTLQFKSTKITDAGLGHLERLPRLRSLSLEGAAITDAGLVTLTSLTSLEHLNLTGTTVTDSGIQEFRKARPEVKVER